MEQEGIHCIGNFNQLSFFRTPVFSTSSISGCLLVHSEVTFAKEEYLFKNVSKGAFFLTNAILNDWVWPQCWYDTNKKERKYINNLLIYTLWCEFSNDFYAKMILAKFLSQKKLVNWNHTFLNYALVCYKGMQHSTSTMLHGIFAKA